MDDAFLPIWNYRIELSTETGYLLLGIYTSGDSREVTTVSTGGITHRSSWNSTHEGNCYIEVIIDGKEWIKILNH